MNIRVPISIQGIVIAAAWAPNGDVTEVDIAGYDEKRYRVFSDHMGVLLSSRIKKRVAVEGFLVTEDGISTLHVDRFHMDPPDEPSAAIPENGDIPL